MDTWAFFANPDSVAISTGALAGLDPWTCLDYVGASAIRSRGSARRFGLFAREYTVENGFVRYVIMDEMPQSLAHVPPCKMPTCPEPCPRSQWGLSGAAGQVPIGFALSGRLRHPSHG
jgi:hypothetical protein